MEVFCLFFIYIYMFFPCLFFLSVCMWIERSRQRESCSKPSCKCSRCSLHFFAAFLYPTLIMSRCIKVDPWVFCMVKFDYFENLIKAQQILCSICRWRDSVECAWLFDTLHSVKSITIMISALIYSLDSLY